MTRPRPALLLSGVQFYLVSRFKHSRAQIKRIVATAQAGILEHYDWPPEHFD